LQYCKLSFKNSIITTKQFEFIENSYFSLNVYVFSSRIKYTVSAKNGGKVVYEDRSRDKKPYLKKQYFLNGIATTEFLEVEFDNYPPVHCFEQSDDCKKDALLAPDFLTQVI
jgi:hypothetical protein